MSEKFTAGQKVVVVRSGNRRNSTSVEEIEIAKVGRKWATIGSGWRTERFDIESMLIDSKGYASPGRIYLSLSDYEDEQRRNRLIDTLGRELGGFGLHARLRDISEENILAAAKLLGIDLERQQ